MISSTYDGLGKINTDSFSIYVHKALPNLKNQSIRDATENQIFIRNTRKLYILLTCYYRLFHSLQYNHHIEELKVKQIQLSFFFNI